MSILAVIPARVGSKRLPNKNFKGFYQKWSLTDLAVEAAVRSKKITHVVVSTNNKKLLYKDYVSVHQRPAELCKDDTPMMPVIKDVVDTYYPRGVSELEMVVLLQPTSPFRQLSAIDDLIDFARGVQHERIATCCSTNANAYPGDGTRPNGNIYIYRGSALLELRSNVGSYQYAEQSSKIEAIDIDTEADWELAQHVLDARRSYVSLTYWSPKYVIDEVILASF